jgi:1-acyl-sn-glycerol-3-phosphate acyltransferase
MRRPVAWFAMLKTPVPYLRAGYRLCCCLMLLISAAVHFIVGIWMRGKAASIPARAQWLKFWSDQQLQILHVKVHSEGRPPIRGIMASNHLSYTDILVYASLHPLVFVSKSEVASWPVVGWFTKCAGTLYISRQHKSDVVRLGEEMVKVVNAGLVVTLFLEGTSTDGSNVLPFRSSLLAPVENHRWAATPACINYTLQDGSVADEVCYWRDMTFGPHFLNLLFKKQIDAFVRFGEPVKAGSDRKEMARALHAEVCRLKGVTPESSGAATNRESESQAA